MIFPHYTAQIVTPDPEATVIRGTVTLSSGVELAAYTEAESVYYDKQPTAKANWSGWHKAPAKLAVSFRAGDDRFAAVATVRP